jgi:hypothetical protein
MIQYLSLSKDRLGFYIISFLIVISTEVSGEIYQFRDKNGVLHFTDTPPLTGNYKKLKGYGNSGSSTSNRAMEKEVTKPLQSQSISIQPSQSSSKEESKTGEPFKAPELQSTAIQVPYKGQSPSQTLKSLSTSSEPLYGDHIQEVAKRYNIDPDLIRAIIKVESNYNPKAVSYKGAQGLMQLMPGTARRFGVNDPFDPQENIAGGAKYLRFLWDLFEGDLRLVLAGYNAGEQNVIRHGNAVPPFAETRGYVDRVLSLAGISAAAMKLSEPIYRYIDKNGVLTFTNIPRLKR